MNETRSHDQRRTPAAAWAALRRWLADTRVAAGSVLAVTALYTAWTLNFVWRYALDSVSRDEWRFIEILDAYYRGALSLQDFWATHSQHRVPAYKIYFLLNALWFGLDTRIGCYIGVIGLAAMCLVLYRHFLRTRAGTAPVAADHYAFLPVVVVIFGCVQAYCYSYDLISFQAIFGIMLLCCAWVYIDWNLRGGGSARRYALVAAVLLALLLLFGAAKGPALVIATLVLCLAIGLMQQGSWPARLALAGWTLGAGIVAQSLYWAAGADLIKGPGLGARLMAVLSDPGGAANYVFRALAATAFYPQVLADPDHTGQAMAHAGAGALVFCLAAVVLYFATRAYRRNLMPLVLGVVAAVYLAELLLGRFGIGENNGAAPRYVFNDHLLLVACAMVFADAGRRWVAMGRTRRGYAVLAALLVLVCMIEHSNLDYAMRRAPAEARLGAEAVGIARGRLQGDLRPYPQWYCPGEALCDAELPLLHEHELSIFRPGNPSAEK